MLKKGCPVPFPQVSLNIGIICKCTYRFSIDYYLLSTCMNEDVQEIFKESSVNNSLKPVPNDSCTFSGNRLKLICV